MKRILVLFVLFGYFLLTYSLEYHEQVYYVAHGTLDRDTIRCVSFDVVNSNMEPIVILFTEDDLEKMNFEEVLYLKSASNLNGNLNCSKELEHHSS